MKLALPVRIGRKLIHVGEQLLEWWGRGGSSTIRSISSETAPPYIGPDLVACMATVPTVYRCVTRKALDKARVPMEIGLENKGDFKPFAQDHEIVRLFRSNPNEGMASLRARKDGMLQLTGDGMLQVERLRGTKPRELWHLPSDRVTIRKGAARRPLAYEYRPMGSAETIVLKPEDVYHTRLPNPADDWRGLTWLRSTTLCAWLEDQIIRYNVEFFARGGVPPGWISFAGFVQDTDRADLREEIQKLTHGKNRRKVGVLWDGAKWNPSGVTAQEGEFIELLEMSKEQIGSAAGVPPIYLNDLRESSYSNALEQKEGYWIGTIDSELDIEKEDLETFIRRIYGDEKLAVRFRLDQVPAVQELRLKKAEALTRLVAGGLMTQNEARADLGLPRATGGDTLYAPQILAPTGLVQQPAPPAKALPYRKAWVDDPARHEKRVAIERDMESFVPEIEKDFVALAERRKARLLAMLDLAPERALRKELPEEFDVEVEIDDTEAVLLRAYAKIVSVRGESAVDEVDDEGGFDSSVPGVTDWMKENAAEHSKLIAKTHEERVREIFASANEESLTASEIATKIEELTDLERAEALRIAWTETGKAYNFATLEGYKQSEVVAKKEWISSRDAFVRTIENGDEYDHAAMDGVQVLLEEDFTVPGAKGDATCSHPGEGPAGNAINCRCSISPVVDEETKSLVRAKRLAPEVVITGDFDALFAEATPNGAH